MEKSIRADAVGGHRRKLVPDLHFLLWSFGAFFIAFIAVMSFRQPNYGSLRLQGREVMERLDAYHAVHGEYPESTAAAGIELPRTRWGSWTYRRRGDSCSISLSTNKIGQRTLWTMWRPYFSLTIWSGSDLWTLRQGFDPC